MKKLLLTISIILFPFSAFAFNISGYTNPDLDNPSGNPDYPNYLINVSGCEDDNNLIQFFLADGTPDTASQCASFPRDLQLAKDHSFFVVETSTPAGGVWTDYNTCIADSGFVSQQNITTTPIASGGVLFGTHYPQSGSDNIGTSTSGILAAVGGVSTEAYNSIFPYLMMSAGVFVGFYIIQQIAIFFGSMAKEKVNNRKSEWTGQGVLEKDVREFKKKKRSRIKRGLE